MAKSKTPAIDTSDKIEVKRNDKGKIWSHLRQKWLDETPEESVRQSYLPVLVNEYGFVLEQMDEELEVTGRGSGHARADFVIWRSVEDKANQKNPLIIVECKSDNVTISVKDYGQGDNYARLTGAKFFVTHNNRETRYWRVIHDSMPKYPEEIENIPHASDSDKDIEELLSKLKVFREDEFAKLLHECHNVIRNRDKLDPAAAFDEIAKILFVKVYIERELKAKRQRKNIFNVEYLDTLPGQDPLNLLFTDTKSFYSKDQIFDKDDRINLKPSTGREVVRRLERYNLSDTSEDIKGIAFERFLGKTFRGEIGQFFTPRTITEFMIRMIEPKEGDVICDPASGSGGFLIRFFEIVRQQILADADRQYQEYKASLEGKKYSDSKKAELLRTKHDEIQATLNQSEKGSRLWNLANRCIYGTDANDRMARTSKMNMIMHGDGHGGVHHHDGFINVNGIFEGRFDIVLTNPPFGANVESEDVILESEVTVPDDIFNRYKADYGQAYVEAQKRVQAAKGKPIASLFEIPKGSQNKIKTEILFIERCLSLLKPSGRLGIVLPEGIFNNPSLDYVREFCEDRAHIKAVVSLPQETFYSSGATVKPSLLFMQKFSIEEQKQYEKLKVQTRAEIEAKYAPEIEAETKRLTAEIELLKAEKTKEASEKRKGLQRELNIYLKMMEERITIESRASLKERFVYPIFMYEADKVGITATGESDQNELFPNPSQPSDCDKTCLEHHQLFKSKPDGYLITYAGISKNIKNKIAVLPPTPRKGSFSLKWNLLERWDTFFYRIDFMDLEYQLSRITTKTLGEILAFSSRSWKKADFPLGEFQYIEISSVTKEDGITGSVPVNVDNAPSRATTLLKTGDIILSTTRPYLGAFAVVSEEYNNCVCSSGFSLATGLVTDEYDINYLMLFLKSAAGLRQMERRMTGGLYPAIVQDELEKVRVPLLPLLVQKQIVSIVEKGRNKLAQERKEAEKRFMEIEAELDGKVLGTDL